MLSRLLLLVCASILLGLAPDRRPIGMFWTGPSVSDGNDGNIEWPAWRIKRDIVAGVTQRPWQRYMIHMPASWREIYHEGQVLMSAGQFYPVSRDRRAAYAEAASAARRARRVLYVYGGLTWQSALTTELTSPPWPPRANDFYASDDHYGMWELVLRPWRDRGVRGWCFDSGAWPPNHRTALAWCRWLREEQGMWAAIEAIPVTAEGEIDVAVAQQVPCMGVHGFHPRMGQWVAPPGTELHVMLLARPTPYGTLYDPTYEPTITVEEVLGYLQRGFIVDPDPPHDAIVVEAMSRFAAGSTIPTGGPP